MACAQDEREGGGQALHMNLLQALLCAGMHSRAAYGYAMAAGHLSSLLNFALLQTVGRLTPSVVSCRSMMILQVMKRQGGLRRNMNLMLLGGGSDMTRGCVI